MATQTVIISPCLRTKDYCFLTINCTASKYCCLLKQYTFCFLNNRQSFWFWLPWKRNLKLNQIPLLSSTTKVSNKSNNTLLRYCTFIFSLSYNIAPVTSYLKVKMRLKTYKMAMSILPRFLTSKRNISRTIWCIQVGDGPGFFLAFFMLFHLSLTFLSTGVSLLKAKIADQCVAF